MTRRDLQVLAGPLLVFALASSAAADEPASKESPPKSGGGVEAPEEDPPFRVSLPTEDDRTAWQRPGLRLQLGVGYGRLVGLDGAPTGRLLGAIIRFGLRLDADWSVLASFQYASASTDGGLSGFRFAGTLDPTWHLTRRLSLAMGLGFGGIVEGPTGRDAPDPAGRAGLNSSYTFPDAKTPLNRCTGVGVVGVLRLSWMYVLGPASSTGFSLQADGQWTGCVDNTRRVEPDTAEAITRRQWWPHVGGTIAWLVAWR